LGHRAESSRGPHVLGNRAAPPPPPPPPHNRPPTTPHPATLGPTTLQMYPFPLSFYGGLAGRYSSSQSPSAEPRGSRSLDAPVRSQLIGNSIDMNWGLSVPAIGDVSSPCLIIHSQLAQNDYMCESQSAPPQMSSTTELFKSWYLLPASLCSHNEAIHIMGSVNCNMIRNLRICSCQKSYSTDIVHFRLAHLQQSSNAQYKHCSIPNGASATFAKTSVPFVFAYLRTRRVTRYVFQ
jgi:hypothetical protein